jgi:S-phase kinase-associated protein 1
MSTLEIKNVVLTVENESLDGSKDTKVVGLDDDDTTEAVLISSDGKEFTLQEKYTKISMVIKSSLETSKDKRIPLEIKSDVLDEIVAYMKHHKGVDPLPIPKPLRSKIMSNVCEDKFDAEFIDRIGENRKLLYRLIQDSNYLNINSLIHLGCAKIASMIKGEPVEKVSEILSKGVDGVADHINKDMNSDNTE